MTGHAVYVTHRCKPGQRQAAVEVWTELLRPAIEANPDHLAYAFTLDENDADVIRAFQLYRTPAAAAEFLRTRHYLEYVEAVEPHLDGPPTVEIATARWVKGAEATG